MPQDANSKSSHDSSALALYVAEDDSRGVSTPDALTSTDTTAQKRQARDLQARDSQARDSQAQDSQAAKTGLPRKSSIVKRVDSATLEASATQVIDEVFEDVDYLLDGAASPQTRPYPPGIGTSFTTNVFMPPEAAATAEAPATPFNALVMLWGLFPAIATGLCLGLALAFGIAINGRQTAVSPPSEGSLDSAPSPEDEAFLAYLDQSLENIARKTPKDAETTVVAGGASSILSANPFEGASGPVPPPPVTAPSAPPAAAQNLPLLPSIPVQTTPIRLAPAPVAPAPPAPAPPAPAPAPAPQSEPASPPEPVAAAPAAPAPAPVIVPNVSPSPHVLVGLLQLGDRSAAIFEFDDGARRVRVGEAIGSSGWSLVSVSQEEAIIRRNGEVRSIYIGQSI